MKIRNTAASSGTTTLHDAECMPADYTVRFDEDDGTVSTVREKVGEALVEKYPSIEPVDSGEVEDESESIEEQAARVVSKQDFGSDNE
ncbi:hypothetical protein [Halalkalicoccus sp. NIPERK01]|uniref:hypothetical protein n=1 Tax=Halalkalicoccus sp. NIPERK01 TaxID=3053469 RepID=UPI00256F49F4|nr:hypothetical protein [Halalkalicoccus sp. NIPERK01]MDL5361351.1 hypothetical protein [Halalkalicoccus sp. NIPERK01]